MSLTPLALRSLSRQVLALKSDPPEGVRLIFDEDDLTRMEGLVQGPAGTPYEGGYFRIKFAFTPEFPNLPPQCTMLTKIFHPNISRHGEICVDTLKKGWKKEYGVGHVLVTIKCLLIYPNPESALDEEAGKQLLEDYEGYCKYARLMTNIHATPKTPPAEFVSAPSSPPKAAMSKNTPNKCATSPNKVSTNSASASSSSTSVTKPSPLGPTTSQEQSPGSKTADSGERVQKVGQIGQGAKSAAKVSCGVNGSGAKVATATGGAAGKVKRGAKRL